MTGSHVFMIGTVLRDTGIFVGSLLAAAAVAIAAHYIVYRVLHKLAARTPTIMDDLLLKRTSQPARWLFVLVGARLALVGLDIGGWVIGSATIHLLSILTILNVAWLLIGATRSLTDYVEATYRVDVSDNLQARKMHTQMGFMRRLLIVVTCIIAAGAVLMTFEGVRQLGTSILASAGIVGIIAGIAAQRSLGTLVAGMQIAITQPIRIDDVVIVEGEWGRIEEITLTYVVVRIWDLRRLVLPITYFVEKPFQNWTRVTAEILGTVFLQMDYTVPVEAIRAELMRILEKSPQWDRKVAGVQVTNCTERTVEVRALMSAGNASAAWDLRCHVREKLIEFVRDNHPQSLPRLRAEVGPELPPAELLKNPPVR